MRDVSSLIPEVLQPKSQSVKTKNKLYIGLTFVTMFCDCDTYDLICDSCNSYVWYHANT